MTHVRPRFSRKTFAIAMAAGVAFGGIQVIGPEVGVNVVSEASAAELDPSIVTKAELISEKSGKNVFGMAVEADDRRAFVDTHGLQYKLKLDFTLPDDAKPGDSIQIKFNDIYGRVKGAIQAPTEEGKR